MFKILNSARHYLLVQRKTGRLMLSRKSFAWTPRFMSEKIRRGDIIHIDLPAGLKLEMRSHTPESGGIVYFINVV